MHLDGAGLAQHPDQSALGIAPHDRVVDDDEPLAPDDLFERVEFQPDSELADGLRRLNEGPSDVGILHQALPVGNAGLLRIADRGGSAGLRNADHQVGVDRAFTGQPTTDFEAGAVHRPAGDRAVGSCQVDVFEDAALGFGVGETGRPHAVGVDRQELARLNVADERGADDVERGGFGGHHPAAVQSSQAQRPYAVRVARGVQGVLVHERQTERTAHCRQQFQRRLFQAGVGRTVGQQCAQHVGVGGGRTRNPGAAKSGVTRTGDQLGAVDQIAVVSQRNPSAGRCVAEHRLRVLPSGLAGGGVSAVPDGDVALHGRQGLLVENLADQTEVFEHQHLRPVRHGDAGGLLAAVLQRVQPVIGEFGDFLAGRPYTEYTAFFAGRVFLGHWLVGGHGGAAPGRRLVT